MKYWADNVITGTPLVLNTDSTSVIQTSTSQAHFNTQCEPGWIEIKDSYITAVGKGRPSPQEPQHYLGQWMFPGFIDIHCHGGNNAHFWDTCLEKVSQAAYFHLLHGTTTLLASTISYPVTELTQQIKTLAENIRHKNLYQIVGIHLEGPFLSPQFKGAHKAEYLEIPRLSQLELLIRSGGGYINMITLAPELMHNVHDIHHITQEGIIVAIGHTDADYQLALTAFDHGANVLTHAFNAMNPLHHRKPGPVMAALDFGAYLEIIPDNYHIHHSIVKHFTNLAESKIIYITDAMSAAGQEDGEYQLGDLQVGVINGQAKIINDQENHGKIAGSTLTIDRAVCNALSWGINPHRIAQVCSANPAKLLGLEDRGRIEPGLRADLVGITLPDSSYMTPHTQVIWGGTTVEN